MRAQLRSPTVLGLPWAAGVGLVVLLPLGLSVALAFASYGGVGRPRAAGLQNYARLMTDPAFHDALRATTVMVAVGVTLRMVLVVSLGVLLARPGLEFGSARVLAFLPSVVPDTALALVWLWVLNPLEGPLAGMVRAAGASSLPLLTDPALAPVTVAAVTALQLGEGLVVVLASRRALPASVYEAAALEGAGPWRVLRVVTLPLLAPVLALLALRDVVVTISATITPALLLTDGGPARSTTTLGLLAYREGFRYVRLGSAAAIGVLVVAGTLGLVVAAAAAAGVLRRRTAA